MGFRNINYVLTVQELDLGNSTCATRSAYKFMPRTIWLLIYFAIHASLHLSSNTVNISYRHLTLTCTTRHLSALLNVSVNKITFPPTEEEDRYAELFSQPTNFCPTLLHPCRVWGRILEQELNSSVCFIFKGAWRRALRLLWGKLEWSLRFWYKYLTLCFSPLSNYIRINWLGPWGTGALGITVLMRSTLSGSSCAGGRRPNNETGWKVWQI